MEAYPEDYVAHNLPLIVLSGLPQAQDILPSHEKIASLSSDLPSLSGSVADQLLHEFLKADGASLPWSDHALANREGLVGFRIANIGRSFAFPPRKAVPPPILPTLSPPQSPATSPPNGLDLHSPLSPLSPTSPIFPDGLMTPLWLSKHQNRVPSVLLSFQHLTSDHSQSTLQDNQLKTDINQTKAFLAKSGYKTRFAVVLVADKRLGAAPDLEDRIAGIRRATGLDSKASLFFFPPPASAEELSTFVTSVITTLQPICIDYYRDLTKHARRKKGRGYVPPPTASARGTSQSLTLHGWNIRFDFKLAVFAEFRQEMDVAERHYESALEELFGPEGNLETTASWSPRWNDCRLLCDIIAFRILRCLIWRGMTSSAAESWCNYKYRMKDLIDRRGKGSDGYGWEAWEARWAKMMAQLIEMAELPIFRPVDLSDNRDSMNAIYAPPEKVFLNQERLPPFHHLHHPGYWWGLVSKHILARRRKAEAIPIEDRTPTEDRIQAANRARTYDTYLVPQPHEEAPPSGHAVYDYLLDVQSQTERAESEFARRGQLRAAQYASLQFARELVRAERYGEALDTLRPVWEDMSWRREGWLDSAKEVLQLMYRSAVRAEARSLVVEVAWEMACKALRFREPIDLMQSLDAFQDGYQRALISLNSTTRLSPVSLGFAFMSTEGFVGDNATAQIVIKFDATDKAAPITLSEMRINFGTNVRSLQISHTDTTDGVFSHLSNLHEEHDPSHPMARSLHCSADLRLRPGQTRVYDVSIPLSEADNFNATGASITLGRQNAVLEYLYASPADIQSSHWLLAADKGLTETRIYRAEPSAITVLPKPPKMQIRILNPRDQYFTNEEIILEVQTANEEEEDANVDLEAKMQDEAGSAIMLSWHTDREERTSSASSSLPIGEIAAAKSTAHHLVLPPPTDPSSYTLSITALYRLASSPDAETPLAKTLAFDISFVSPFEANYDFGPRLHDEDYPDFFRLPDLTASESDGGRKPEGIEQRWCLTSRVASFASEALIIESTSIVVNKITSNSLCILDETPEESRKPITIEGMGMVNVAHTLNTRKYTLEDRRPSTLDMSLSITWRRRDAHPAPTTTTLLAIPNLAVPAAEPRVLCTLHSPEHDTDPMVIKYTLENPSMHFLNFMITMEASDEFAFSGPKFRAVSMTPMSRVSVEYNILVYEHGSDDELTVVNGRRGRWIWPVVRIMDPYFNRALRVLDGGVGVMSDEKGNVGIWVAAD